jgi:hypothetical protein
MPVIPEILGQPLAVEQREPGLLGERQIGFAWLPIGR